MRLLHPRIHPDDLFVLKEVLWPYNAVGKPLNFHSKQVEIVESVLTCPETYVPAANKMGKDFICGFIAPAVFVVCAAKGITCRIVTTSVAEHHLKVLWGEIGRFVTTSRKPLVGRAEDQFTMNYMEMRRASEANAKNPLNYLVGRVSERGEGLAGHHAEFTMLIGDEASGLDDKVHEMGQGWAKSMLFIGNPNPCNNFFRKAVKDGNLVA